MMRAVPDVGRNNPITSLMANELGNLFSRSTAMAVKYFAGVLPAAADLTEIDQALKKKTEDMVANVATCMDDLAFSKSLQAIWEVVSAGNIYIDDTAPWTLAKDPANKDRLATVMYCLLESQRIVHIILSAFIPATSEKALANLGCGCAIDKSGLVWGGLRAGCAISKVEALFPRYDEN